jgi:hypothetical protein
MEPLMAAANPRQPALTSDHPDLSPAGFFAAYREVVEAKGTDDAALERLESERNCNRECNDGDE